MIDKEKVLNSCTAEEVARKAGMKIYPKGSKNYILCPGHRKMLGKDDRSPTNAILTPHGYKCYACGRKANTIDMISDYTGLPFYEALKYVCELLGGEEYFKEDDGRRRKRASIIPLSTDQMDLIGLRYDMLKEGKIAHISEIKDDQCNYTTRYDEDIEAYITFEPSNFSIKDLFYDDYPAYCFVVKSACENQLRNLVSVMSAGLSPEFMGERGVRTKEMQELIMKKWQEMTREVYSIYEEYCGKLKEKPLPLEQIA